MQGGCECTRGVWEEAVRGVVCRARSVYWKGYWE